jgi:UDP-3-O-[3-hydroxymyristoyl] glucosamine N-acyltransferase
VSVVATAGALAALVGGRLCGVAEDAELRGFASLQRAGPGDIAFAERVAPADCAAGLLLVRQALAGRPCLVVEEPRRAFALLLRTLMPEEPRPGVHPRATVDPSAILGEGVVIEAGCVVGADCVIGDRSVLFANVVLYPGTILGPDCRIHAGAVLGCEGFSFVAGPQGPEKMPQRGRLILGARVEVGANSALDRGALDDTVIGDDVKIDKLVLVGHNAQLGRGVILAGQVGLAGSVSIGPGALLGGQVGVADHATIGAGARIGAQSGLSGTVPPGEALLGTPAMPLRLTRRIYAALRHLPALVRPGPA